MKANINITQGESTKQHIERKVGKYLSQHERMVSINEVYEYLSNVDKTVSRMTEQGFENIVASQVMTHAMKHM